VVQSVKCLTLDFDSGHELRVVRAPYWAPCQVWHLLKILSLLLPHAPPSLKKKKEIH